MASLERFDLDFEVSGSEEGFRMVIPPHCGTNQLVAWLSFTISGVICLLGT